MAERARALIPLPQPRQTPYGVLRARYVHGDADLPAETDVAIIGGGISGVMAAYFLAGRGVRVVLCEKAEIACEASSRAFGWVSELLLDPCKMALSAESKRLWEIVHSQAGETGFRRDGLAYLAENDEELEFYASWLESVRGTEADAGNRMLTTAGVRDRYPGMARDWAGAILGPGDGCVEPQLAAAAVAQAARRAGAAIVTNCAVRTIDVAGGRVAGIHTERGLVRASRVLFAGNAWSRLFLGNHGIDVPQLMVHMSMGSTDPAPDGPVGCGGQEEWAWRRQIDGGYALGRLRGQKVPLTRDCIQLFSRFIPFARAEWRNVEPSLDSDARADWLRRRRWTARDVSPMERERVLVPHCDAAVPDSSLKLNRKVFSALRDVDMRERWAGVLTATPDNLPIASAITKLPGLFLITGCSYGLSWAPALAKLVADLMTGSATTLDPAPYRHDRFFDGTPLRLTQ